MNCWLVKSSLIKIDEPQKKKNEKKTNLKLPV